MYHISYYQTKFLNILLFFHCTIKIFPLKFITFLNFMHKLFGVLSNFEMARKIPIKILTQQSMREYKYMLS